MRSRNLSYAFCVVPFLLTFSGNLLGGWWAGANLAFILVLLGGLEWLVPSDQNNEPNPSAVLPNFLLFMALPLSLLATGSLLYGIYTGTLTGGYVWLAAASTGFHSGAMGIVAAHEMIHRSEQRWVLGGKILLFNALNAYFFVDHLRVHHRYVGTTRDHATARYGEDFYSFLWRSLTGQIGEALQLEATAARKKGRAAYGLHNYFVRNSLGHLLLLLGLAFLAWPLAAAMLMQAAIANILLEYTNYIEHYGILRPENTRVDYATSWQSDKWFSRFLLYDLSRHSDHHVHGARPYHELRSFEAAPVLPGGYASLILPALIPPLWFRMIHPQLKENV